MNNEIKVKVNVRKKKYYIKYDKYEREEICAETYKCLLKMVKAQQVLNLENCDENQQIAIHYKNRELYNLISVKD